MIWAEAGSPENKDKLTLLGLVIILIIAYTIGVFWILARIRQRVDIRLDSTLHSVLDTTDKSLRTWINQTEADVEVLANGDDLPLKVEEQLRLGRDASILRTSMPLQGFRHLLAPAVRFYELDGFALLAPDGFEIAADTDDAIGTRDIAEHNPTLLSKVMAGSPAAGLPYKAHFDGRGAGTRTVVTIAAPVWGASGNVIAALALNFDARRNFTAVIEAARPASTGQSYFFDRPYTAGENLQGYRDYRGVPVIGAWLWDDRLGIGLVTEIDHDEAFAGYRSVRNLVVSMLLSLVGVSVLILLILGQRGRVLALYERSRLALHARDDMMAVVAHDLKNPLSSMLLRSHLMLQMTADCGEKSAAIRQNLVSLQDTVRHMNRVISDLTDAVKIEAGRLELERRECPLKEAFRSAVESMRLLFGEKRIDFAAHIPEEGKSLNVDLSRLGQALENLLGNALKFTPPGGSVTLKVTPMENEVEVSLTDTGPGIPPDAAERIFEPYWQGARTRSGMGLGLFIAKKIIETHGGKIWVQSTPGHGATFYFTLPYSFAL